MTLCIFNNEWVDLEDLTIPITSESVQYGVGLFETMRTYKNKVMPFLDEHLQRFNHSVSELNLSCAYSTNEIQEMIERLVDKSPHEYQRVKLLLLSDGILVTSFELVNIEFDIAKLTHWQVNRSLAQHKTTSYLDCHLAWQYALANGYDDSILIDENGWVTETGRANLFWVRGGVVYTTEQKVLPGIIRGFIIESLTTEVTFERIKLSDLYHCDEVFITNSIRGVQAVNQINDTNYGSHVVTEECQKLLQAYIS